MLWLSLSNRQMVVAYVSATTSALVTALSFKSFMSTVCRLVFTCCTCWCIALHFMKYFVKYFWNISKISRCWGCIVHCNKVSKPVIDKYLLLCMNSVMYFLLTSYTLIMFLKVLGHFIMKITISWNISKKRSWNILKNFHEIFEIFQNEIFHRASLIVPCMWS